MLLSCKGQGPWSGLPKQHLLLTVISKTIFVLSVLWTLLGFYSERSLSKIMLHVKLISLTRVKIAL